MRAMLAEHIDRTILSSLTRKAGLALVAGALMPLAFAPYSQTVFTLLSPLLLLFAWQDTTPKQAFWLGWLYGIGLMTVGASWLYISIHYYGHTSPPLAILATAFFIANYSILHGFQGYLFRRCLTPYPLLNAIGLYPCLWLLCEFARTKLWGGFPWLLIGYAEVDSHYAGLAPIIGGFGLTLLITLLAGLWYYALRRSPRYWLAAAIIHLVILFSSTALLGIHWTQQSHKTLKVALIQGNTPLEEQFDARQITHILETYNLLTFDNWQNRLIIWPESSIPIPYQYVKHIINRFDENAKQHHATLMVGLPVRASHNEAHYKNTLLSLGLEHGHYSKQHLVPFGDYLPFENMLRGLINLFDIPMSDFVPGQANQPRLTVNHIQIIPAICYDVGYTGYLLRNLPAGELLLTISNDAWFRDSIAGEQHLQIARLRALESGRSLLFSNNSGITALISPLGKVQARLPIFEKSVLDTSVHAMTGATPWSHIGDLPFVLIALVIVVLCTLIRHFLKEND